MIFDLLPIGDALTSPSARELHIKNSALRLLSLDNPFLPDRTDAEVALYILYSFDLLNSDLIGAPR
jgi:hypothetical protein